VPWGLDVGLSLFFGGLIGYNVRRKRLGKREGRIGIAG
jgi:hypothetical protein